MSRLLKRQENFINLLLQPTLNVRQRVSLLKHATKEQILALSEIVLNVLRGTFDLSGEEKKILFPYRNGLRRISQEKDKINWQTRRTLMIKHAKALHTLLKLVRDKIANILQ